MLVLIACGPCLLIFYCMRQVCCSLLYWYLGVYTGSDLGYIVISYKLLFIPCSCPDHCTRNYINLFSHHYQTTSHQSLRSESPSCWGPRVNPRQQWSPCSYRSWHGGRSSWGRVPNHHCDTAGGDRISVCGMEEG